MQRIAVRLEEWRSAERRRDSLPRGSPEWQDADDEVHRAQAVYRGEISQAAAYYAELDFAAQDRSIARWPVRLDRTPVLND